MHETVMKKYLPIIVLVSMMVTGLTSCEEIEVTNNTFTFNVTFKHSRFIYVDIYPETNGFPYTAFVATLDDLENKGTRGLIDSVHAQLPDSCIYTRGSRLLFDNLKPGIEYYVCCYRMDNDLKPVYTKLVRYAFTTPLETYTPIDFTWSSRGDSVFVHPSNNNTYYWDYELKSIIKSEYKNEPWVYFFYQIAYYQTYDMMTYMVSAGESQDCVSDYIILTEGDTLCFMAAPYTVTTGYAPYPQVWYAVWENDNFRFL